MQNMCSPQTETVAVSRTLFASADQIRGSELDVGMLSEYLFEDDRHGKSKSPKSAKLSGLEVTSDISDDEDFSSNDDGDGLKRSKMALDGKGKSQDQIDRRRERNRVLARKTRLRKKFFFESLQRQVAQLTMENEMLKGIVKQRMASELKSQILAECSTESSTIVATATNATSLLERADYGLMAAIQAAQRSFCLTDPSLPDNPIVFASKGFLELSGYSLGEVLGRNCRFMQGPSTDQSQVDVLRKGILAGVDTSICLLNYKADGTPFYNQIFVAALRDSSKKIINYVGVQVEIKPVQPSADMDDDEFDDDVKTTKKGRAKSKSLAALGSHGIAPAATTKAAKVPKAPKTIKGTKASTAASSGAASHAKGIKKSRSASDLKALRPQCPEDDRSALEEFGLVGGLVPGGPGMEFMQSHFPVQAPHPHQQPLHMQMQMHQDHHHQGHRQQGQGAQQHPSATFDVFGDQRGSILSRNAEDRTWEDLDSFHRTGSAPPYSTTAMDQVRFHLQQQRLQHQQNPLQFQRSMLQGHGHGPGSQGHVRCVPSEGGHHGGGAEAPMQRRIDDQGQGPPPNHMQGGLNSSAFSMSSEGNAPQVGLSPPTDTPAHQSPGGAGAMDGSHHMLSSGEGRDSNSDSGGDRGGGQGPRHSNSQSSMDDDIDSGLDVFDLPQMGNLDDLMFNFDDRGEPGDRDSGTWRF